MALALALVGCAHGRPLVLAAGDLQLGAGDPLSALAPWLSADLRFANLEGPLTLSDAPSADAAVRLRADPSEARHLAHRLDVVSLANNHALDQGEAGRDDTVAALTSRQVAVAFFNHDAEMIRRGQRVTVLARYFPPDANLEVDGELIAAVKRARTRGAVVVSLHWGHTGSLLPTAAQRRLGARLIDAGAAAVLGHGPHTLQGIERRGRGIIAYSLGNLAFACGCTDVADAYLLRFRLAIDGGADEVEALPIVAGLGRPAARSLDPDLAALIAALSRDLGSRVRIEAGLVLIE